MHRLQQPHITQSSQPGARLHPDSVVLLGRKKRNQTASPRKLTVTTGTTGTIFAVHFLLGFIHLNMSNLIINKCDQFIVDLVSIITHIAGVDAPHLPDLLLFAPNASVAVVYLADENEKHGQHFPIIGCHTVDEVLSSI